MYSTRRNGLDILIPKVRTESAKKGTFYTGAQAFSNLPPHLKEVDSIVIFKTLLNDIIFRVLVNICLFLFFRVLICIGSSMICSDIWHKYPQVIFRNCYM